MYASVVTPPASEPVSLDEAKAWLKATGTDDDAQLLGLVSAARELAEAFTNRSFVSRTLAYRVEPAGGREPWFPGHYELPYDYFRASRWPARVRLPGGPVTAVTSFSVDSSSGSPVVWDPSSYRLSGDALEIIGPSSGDWLGRATVTYVAGYGGPAEVPSSIKTAILMTAASMFSERAGYDVTVMPAGIQTLKSGDSTITRFANGSGPVTASGLPSAAERQLRPFRIFPGI